ncbi:MAG: hypothetical protein P9M03_08765 [Candidatus Theseobacter exili]|nr:hypothetical protein [Candidatus Theseobacter exili]
MKRVVALQSKDHEVVFIYEKREDYNENHQENNQKADQNCAGILGDK